MSQEKQMINDLIEIFNEEYGKRLKITPQNTAEKLTAKGYRKASEVAREIIEEAEKIFMFTCSSLEAYTDWQNFKKKYTEGGE